MNFKHLVCDECGALTETRLVNDFVPLGRQRYYVENMSIEVCPRCASRYYPGPLIEEIQRQVELGQMRPAA